MKKRYTAIFHDNKKSVKKIVTHKLDINYFLVDPGNSQISAMSGYSAHVCHWPGVNDKKTVTHKLEINYFLVDPGHSQISAMSGYSVHVCHWPGVNNNKIKLEKTFFQRQRLLLA